QFLDEHGAELEPGGGALSKIDKVIKTPDASKFDDGHFRVACDVNNPLYGTDGATYIFGPQKGVTEERLSELDNGLKTFAEVTERQMMSIYPRSRAAALQAVLVLHFTVTYTRISSQASDSSSICWMWRKK